MGKGAAFARFVCASVFLVITIALALNAHFLIAGDTVGDRGGPMFIAEESRFRLISKDNPQHVMIPPF